MPREDYNLSLAYATEDLKHNWRKYRQKFEEELYYMENKAIINVNIGDTNIDFCYPDSQYMKNIILSVFSGNDYPIIQIPDYSPNIIFDIGANIGAVALYFYAHFPESQIYCYEPLTMNYAYLKENTKYFDKIHTYPFGLYDKSANLPWKRSHCTEFII